ncbi:protein LIAT1 [Syngnathoides biaculeatus]|uniref:protein LIAT1 n=1 Tax=Syngnathoides biaculeatus TaxID=300417 RepID=UPI002ADE87F1|nr:protein LIAT1 [Syngnathoides biaculeatus]
MSEEEQQHKLKISSSSDDKKKKRKKRKKRKKHTPPRYTVDPNPAVEPAVRVTPVPRGQTSKRRAACKKNKEPPREPPPPADDIPPDDDPVTAPDETVLDEHARECLRWEGVLPDPWAEEERLEAYRANRRRRYAALRDAQLN